MRSRLGLFAALLLTALPTLAADRVIQSGIDTWYTPGDGQTYIDFATIPLPAGFFCFKSEPFSGRVIFQGVPVATGEAGVLRKTDTIIERLDEAAFDKDGVARTRIQVKVLHFVGVEPIKTACGDFNVEVHLNGEQPITNMRIVRENAHGGRFFAQIAVNGKLVFTPAGGRSREVLELTRNVRFPANQGISWADHFAPKQGIQRAGFIQVDTDNDRMPDTFLPGTTANFAAGAHAQQKLGSRGPEVQLQQPPPVCHIVPPTEGHCPLPPETY